MQKKYEFVFGAHLRTPFDKNACWTPGEPADDENNLPNLMTVMRLSTFHMVELECRKADVLLGMLRVKDNVVYAKIGVWDATGVDENDFEAGERMNRAEADMLTLVWLPAGVITAGPVTAMGVREFKIKAADSRKTADYVAEEFKDDLAREWEVPFFKDPKEYFITDANELIEADGGAYSLKQFKGS